MTYVATWEIDVGGGKAGLWARGLRKTLNCWNATPLWNFPPGAVWTCSNSWERLGDGSVRVQMWFKVIDDDSLLSELAGHDFAGVIPEDATWEREGVAA